MEGRSRGRRSDGSRLKTEEIGELARQANRGNEKALEDLVAAHRGLTEKIAWQFRGSKLELEDLQQTALLGLLIAIRRFEPGRGLRLSTYATPWVKQVVRRAIENQARAIRIPVNVQQKQRRVLQARDRLCAKLAREPREEEIAQEAGVGVKEARWALTLPDVVVSLDQPSHDCSSARLGDVLSVEEEQCSEEVERRFLVEQVLGWIDHLPELERTVIVYRFGLEGVERETLEQVATRLGGYSRQGVQNIERRALEKVRRIAGKEE